MSSGRLPLALLLSSSVLAIVAAQPDTRPAFAVVSVKKNTSGTTDGQRMRLQPGGRLVVANQPLRNLVLFAYGLQPQQLFGGPPWMDSDRFDIVAQADGEIPPSPPGGPPGRAQLMFQQLLADRFKLAVHTESRDVPVYALTLAREGRGLGPKIRPATTDCAALMKERAPIAPPRLPDGRPACGMTGQTPGRVWAGGTTFAALASALTGTLGRIVFDRTGVSGGFDFELEFTPDAQSADTERPSIFTALEEQLGLKLRPQRAAVDVLVIDHVEPPTEN